MLGRRSAVSRGAAFACGVCAAPLAFSQKTPQSVQAAAPAAAVVAPVCGFDKVSRSVPSNLKRLSASGIDEVDRHIAEEAQLLNRLFRTSPKFGFFDDGNEPQARTVMVGDTAEVLVGTKLLSVEDVES